MGMAVIHWGMCYPYQKKIPKYCLTASHWRTQEFFFGGGSTNSVEDRENRDLGVVVP